MPHQAVADDEAEGAGRRGPATTTKPAIRSDALPFVGADLFEHAGGQNVRCSIRTAPWAPLATPRRPRSTPACSNFIMRAKITDGNACELGVVVQHAVVVELPRVGHSALGGGQLLLQGEEVLVGLEVGVGLAQGEQLAQRAGELVAGLGLAGGRVGCGDGGVAGLHDGVERLLLVGGVALDGLDEVGDEVDAPLELHVDLRPRVLDLVAQPDETVVGRRRRR